VLRQVVGPGEALITVDALETLFPRVRSLVPGELVGPGETFPAHGKGALERPLPAVPTEVGLQVGRLAVDLSAAFDVADVLLARLGDARSRNEEAVGSGAIRTLAPFASSRLRRRRRGGRDRVDLDSGKQRRRLRYDRRRGVLKMIGRIGGRVVVEPALT